MTAAAIIWFLSLGLPLPLVWRCQTQAPSICLPDAAIRGYQGDALGPMVQVIFMRPCQPMVCS